MDPDWSEWTEFSFGEELDKPAKSNSLVHAMNWRRPRVLWTREKLTLEAIAEQLMYGVPDEVVSVRHDCVTHYAKEAERGYNYPGWLICHGTGLIEKNIVFGERVWADSEHVALRRLVKLIIKNSELPAEVVTRDGKTITIARSDYE